MLIIFEQAINLIPGDVPVQMWVHYIELVDTGLQTHQYGDQEVTTVFCEICEVF